MNEERIGKYLRQVQNLRGHLWQIFHNRQPSRASDIEIEFRNSII